MTARWLVLVVVGCSGVAAQPQPEQRDRFRQVKKWRGEYRVSLDGGGHWSETTTAACIYPKPGTDTTVRTGDIKLRRSSRTRLTLDQIDPADTQTTWRGSAKVAAETSIESVLVADFTPGCPSKCGRSVTNTKATIKSLGSVVPEHPDAGELIIDFETGRYDVTLMPFVDPVSWKSVTTESGSPGCGQPARPSDLGELQLSSGGAVSLNAASVDFTSALPQFLSVEDPEALLRQAQDPSALAAAARANGLELPASGMTLTGHRDIPLRVLPLLGGPGHEQLPGRATVRIEWTFEPADLEELQVVVTPDSYDEWLPMATTDEHAAGNRIGVTAQLLDRDGRPSTQKASKFRFELLDVSHQPGVAMNFPHDPEATPDLQFEALHNPQLIITGSDKAERGGGELGEARAVVSSFDWGAWGRIKVIAEMPGGREIVGHLITDTSMELIRLPKRREGSKIGDFWKVAHHVEGTDLDDEENDPVGDGHRGDGFSLYEEARGFYENGHHIFGDPHKKDLFIRDRVGGDSKVGIALLEQISKLVVHDELTAEEFRSQDRVINDNHDDATPRRGDQTGLLIISVPPRGFAQTVGGPGVPKTISYLEIPTNLRRGGAFDRPLMSEGVFYPGDRYATSIAHELLHGCNVFHHGEGDEEELVWELGGSAGAQVITEHGRPITVRFEQGGTPVTMRPDDPPRSTVAVYVGVERGQHSGEENCVMRYDNSIAYRKHGEPSVLYWVHAEAVGMGLCEGSVGTGVNAPGRRPQPRYFDATEGKGACAHQLCVNDRAHP